MTKFKTGDWAFSIQTGWGRIKESKESDQYPLTQSKFKSKEEPTIIFKEWIKNVRELMGIS